MASTPSQAGIEYHGFPLFSRLRHLADVCLRWLNADMSETLRSEVGLPLNEMISKPDRLVLRVANYPFAATSGSGWLAAEHHDICLLTLLPTPTHCGFEVRTPAGEWLRPSQANAITVIPGEMLQICTRGYYPATLHRVVKPSDAPAGSSRMSLNFFVNPYDDVVLAPGRTARQVLNARLAAIGY